MKKLLSLTLALVMIVTCLAGISFAADPIATVETNGKTVEVATVEDMIAAIDASGKSVVTLKADVTCEKQTTFPYSCVIDMNGHTWTAEKSNAFAIAAAGTENEVATLKNGIVLHKVVGIRVNGGGLIVKDMIMRGTGGASVCFYDATGKYNDVNLVENCTLVSDIYGTVGYNNKDTDFTKCNFTIRDTVMVCPKEAGSDNFIKNGSGCLPGNVTLGTGVEIYSYKAASYAVAGYTFSGETLTTDAALATIEVPTWNLKFAGMTKRTTPPTPAPVVPETPATPAAPETPAAPATPSVPTTGTPDVTTPATGVSVIALGVMAMVSLAGAVVTKKH